MSDFMEQSWTFFPEDGVGLVPKHGCLLALAYYAFPRWYEFGEWWWNDILTGENWRTRRKTCPCATSSTINSACIDPGANLGLRGERPATNDLNHSTALSWTYTHHIKSSTALNFNIQPNLCDNPVSVTYNLYHTSIKSIFSFIIYISGKNVLKRYIKLA
jgi:hypothetical protein